MDVEDNDHSLYEPPSTFLVKPKDVDPAQGLIVGPSHGSLSYYGPSFLKIDSGSYKHRVLIILVLEEMLLVVGARRSMPRSVGLAR